MKLPFSLRLAVGNLRKQSRSSLPFLLASIGVVAMQFMIATLGVNPELERRFGGNFLIYMLGFGRRVTAVFACVLLFYTHSFLIKRRLKEFAVYHILGMQKRHIGWVLMWESLTMLAVSLALGAGLGALLSKLMYALLMRATGLDVMGFHFSWDALASTAALFACLYAVIHASDVLRLRLSRPVTLLRDARAGEREPKHSWIGALLGVACLGAGYAIAVSIQDPILALATFFFAVLLVMAGTYLLFGAGSIALLKLLRRNPRYYYQPNHFISVSGMIFRMKRNAVGLANICILSTMALVTASTTLALWCGIEDILVARHPYEFYLVSYGEEPDAEAVIHDAMARAQIETRVMIPEAFDYRQFSVSMLAHDGALELTNTDGMSEMDLVGRLSALREMVCVPLSDFNRNNDSDYALAPGEALAVSLTGAGEPISRIHMADLRLTVTQTLPASMARGVLSFGVYPTYVVAMNDGDLQAAYEAQRLVYGWNASEPRLYVTFDVPDATGEQKLALNSALVDALSETDVAVSCREADRRSTRMDFGGTLFVGMFLGALFLAATALIIYYKQVSEGLEDRSRYEIMRKVGLTRQEIRATVSSQILTVFFLPPLTAAVHVAFAFPMIRRLLLLFNMDNTRLYVCCTLGSLACFLLVYAGIYVITARSYTRIVTDKMPQKSADF